MALIDTLKADISDLRRSVQALQQENYLLKTKMSDLEQQIYLMNYKPKQKVKMTTIRTQKQIDDLLNRCAEAEETGESVYPGMSYEQGIKAAIEWLDGGDYPFD